MDSTPWVKMNDRMRRRTLASGRELHSILVHFQAGGSVPMHQHPHEQITYVISGRLKLTIDGVTHYVPSGEAICIKGKIPHEAIAVVETYCLDTFSPPRQDILDRDLEEAKKHDNG